MKRFWLPTGQRSPIGLDIGDCVIKAAQLERGGSHSPPTLACTLALERAAPGERFDQAEAARLRQVLARHGFTGRKVVVAIPGRWVMASVLTLPPRKEGVPLDAIARSELAHEHSCQSDAFEMAWWEMPRPARTSGGTHAMAVGCAHALADEMIGVLRKAGFDVLGMDTAGWAVARACEPVIKDDAGIVAAMDLGWDSTTLMLLHEGVLVYQRSTFGSGMRQLRTRLEQEQQFQPQVIDYLLTEIGFNADPSADREGAHLMTKCADQLEAHYNEVVRELTLSLDYAHSQYPHAPVNRVVLLGGGAAVPGADRYIASALEVQVDVLRPADVTAGDAATGAADQLPSLMQAIGLACPHQAHAKTHQDKEAA